MRNILVIALFMFCLPLIKGQTAEEEVIRLKMEQGSVTEEQPVEEEKKPGHWNFNVGTSYSYMKGYGSGMMFYTAPMYTLDLTNRWSIHGGVVASHYQGINSSFAGETPYSNSFSGLALFAAASYRATDRLILHGAGTKQLLTAPVTPFTPYLYDDLSLGATYRIGDNMTIGASIHMRNGNGYYNSPFSGNPFVSPFGW